MPPVINIDSQPRQFVIDCLHVCDNFLMAMTHDEVEDAENCRHKKRQLNDDFQSHLDDDRGCAVADVDLRALD